MSPPKAALGPKRFLLQIGTAKRQKRHELGAIALRRGRAHGFELTTRSGRSPGFGYNNRLLPFAEFLTDRVLKLMTGNWKDKAELIGIAAILVSLAFVGLELRATNVQSRANAFQSLGIATSEFHQAFDDRLNLLFDQFNDLEALDRWTYSDSLAAERMLRADVRLLETALLQVDQGLLDAGALDYLGFSYTVDWLTIPAVACLWPRVSQGFGRVGPLVRQRVEDGTSLDRRAECPVDLSKLRNEIRVGS